MTETDLNAVQRVAEVQAWLQEQVIGLDLCPFAKRPLEAGVVHIQLSEAENIDAIVREVYAEMSLLWDKSPEQIETSLLVFPALAKSFDEYLDCLELVEQLIDGAPWQDEIQIASFHPLYCFDGVAESDPGNYTNRSPYPIFHLLREKSLEQAIDWFGDTAVIPQRNIARLRAMSGEELASRFPKK